MNRTKLKLNIDSFTIFKTEFKMNKKSLENLTGKSKSGFMSRASSAKLRQIIYNALRTIQIKNNKKHVGEHRAPAHADAKSPHTKALPRVGTSGAQPFSAIIIKKR